MEEALMGDTLGRAKLLRHSHAEDFLYGGMAALLQYLPGTFVFMESQWITLTECTNPV